MSQIEEGILLLNFSSFLSPLGISVMDEESVMSKGGCTSMWGISKEQI